MAQKVSVDKSLAIRISIRDMKIMQEIPIRVPNHIPTYLHTYSLQNLLSNPDLFTYLQNFTK
jgi:hypothetical protein